MITRLLILSCFLSIKPLSQGEPLILSEEVFQVAHVQHNHYVVKETVLGERSIVPIIDIISHDVDSIVFKLRVLRSPGQEIITNFQLYRILEVERDSTTLKWPVPSFEIIENMGIHIDGETALKVARESDLMIMIEDLNSRIPLTVLRVEIGCQ